MRNFNSKLKNRQRGILQKLVRSYIQKGEPIASQFLVVHYNFDVSSATIRNDFQELTEQGYLYKFHISGGRIPTDKAWKFFVQMISKDDDAIDQWRIRWEIILKQRTKPINDWEKVVNFLSEESQSLGFCYLKDDNEVKKCGLKYVFSSLLENFPSSLDLIPEIAESLENLDVQIKKVRIEDEPLVFIGRDNPFINSDEFSVVLVKTRHSNNILGILGNKRMPYDRNIGLLSALIEKR
ncbi:MAG: DeoR family transcriptional regulator [Candidatus Paceibacterota bacterium]|jgi:transcriptional regulator of heat shock response